MEQTVTTAPRRARAKAAARGTAAAAPDRDQPDWYKDAIIYQLHVKAFQDTTGDGIGDFAGLMQRLDYVQELGVTAIWLMPFYPSPLRDDGYDIADYRSINPSYGTHEGLQGLRRRGAPARPARHHRARHQPHLRPAPVVPEGAARRRPGSAARDMYVWCDTDQKYPRDPDHLPRHRDRRTGPGTRSPTPSSGTASTRHQPDLNFDNPRVLEEVLKVMRMWLDMGVDGLRLDAIPYLVEREGTNNENLPETHDVLKAIRAELDRHYPDRMLLAEANQWPEDTRPYFGEGDECHMGFHFPLMPRMYMALAQADRHPITDIIRQTPEIPDTCQWAIFLRNHDELTLEMVTDDERDYLWKFYAEDARARINLGIRRRLAPLMKNDRRKIELLNSHALLDARDAGRLLRRRDRHGRQLLPRRPRRGAHADAVVGRPQRRLQPRQPAAALPADDHRPGLRLPGDQRRGAGGRPLVAAELDAADDRGAQAASRPSAAAR